MQLLWQYDPPVFKFVDLPKTQGSCLCKGKMLHQGPHNSVGMRKQTFVKSEPGKDSNRQECHP